MWGEFDGIGIPFGKNLMVSAILVGLICFLVVIILWHLYFCGKKLMKSIKENLTVSVLFVKENLMISVFPVRGI